MARQSLASILGRPSLMAQMKKEHAAFHKKRAADAALPELAVEKSQSYMGFQLQMLKNFKLRSQAIHERLNSETTLVIWLLHNPNPHAARPLCSRDTAPLWLRSAQARLNFGSGLLRSAQVLAHPAHSPRRSPAPPHQKLSGFSDGAQNQSPGP